MANIELTSVVDFPVDTIGGSEKIPVSDGSTPKHITPDLLSTYIIDDIEAIAAMTSPGSDDSFMMLENDNTLKPCTYENIEDAIAESMYAESEIGAALADADIFLVHDNAATKTTCLASRIATYTLSKNEATILDISSKAANSTPADAHLLLTVDGTTAKKTTMAEMRSSVLGGLDSYVIALGAAAAGSDSDTMYVLQSGTEKEMTLSQLKTYVGVSVTGSGTTGKIPKFASASSLTDGYTAVDTFVAGSATALPSSLGVRTEMNDIIFDETAMGSALADADTMLICDGDIAEKQYKSTLTQLNTWINTHYAVELESLTAAEVTQLQAIGATTISAAQWAYLGGMDQDVATTDTPEFAGMTITDTKNIVLAAGTGTKIGTATSQKLGFWNVTPVIQPADADQADQGAMTGVAVGDLVATNGGWGYSSEVNADAVHTAIDQLVADVTALDTLLTATRTALVNSGVMKGSA